jgi:hypothetical protein
MRLMRQAPILGHGPLAPTPRPLEFMLWSDERLFRRPLLLGASDSRS